MNAAIIGCGYVGSALAKKWKTLGIQVTATTRKMERLAALSSLADKAVLIPPNNQLNFYQSLAKDNSVLVLCLGADSPGSYESAYLRTAETLARAVSCDCCVSQIIYTSSTSVYGDRQGDWVDETSPLIPLNDCSKILVKTEEALMKLSTESLRVCILRLGEIYGPGRDIHTRLQRLSKLPFPGTGENYTNLVHLDTILSAIEFARLHRLSGIYNLCQKLHIKRKEFYGKLCKEYGLPEVVWDSSLTSLHGGNKRVSTKKIESLGFTATLHDY